MVGGGHQRACASTFRRLMPTSQGSQGSQEAEGSVVRGRGLGRGKGGPKGRGRGRPRRRAEEEEQQYEPEEEEEDEDDTVASAESSGGEEEEEEGEDATEEDSTPAVWLRGPSRLPDRPIPLALRPLIRPSGPR